ncbi:MAG: DUF4296 domain-containing protein [Bacteroidaceae bacterium]|nr:DUF4296 domain-containing protein [Bacteroidaceae bacterium]
MIQKTIKYILCATLFLLVSCNVDIPKDIIQPAELEALLYDYHLVQAMSTDAEGGEYKRRLYAGYVFGKHNVTKEHFDSSLMWYARNPKYLHSIYSSLYDRLDTEVALMTGERKLAKSEKDMLNRDTLDLWREERIMLLSSSPFMGRKAFAYEADSTFVVGDSVSFAATVHFVSPGNEPSSSAHIALVVEYKDNTSSSAGATITHDGCYTLEVPRNTTAAIKALSGHVYYMPGDSLTDERLLVGGLSLKRIHPAVTAED